METRHAIEGSFGNDFPSICNHCGVMADRSCKTLEKNSNVLLFWKNDPLQENFQNSVPKGFIATPIYVLCSNFVKFGRREIGEVVLCYLPDKKNKISPGSPALASARIAPKFYHCQPQMMCSECSRFHPNRFTFGRVIRMREHRQSARQSESNIRLKPSLEPNNEIARRVITICDYSATASCYIVLICYV